MLFFLNKNDQVLYYKNSPEEINIRKAKSSNQTQISSEPIAVSLSKTQSISWSWAGSLTAQITCREIRTVNSYGVTESLLDMSFAWIAKEEWPPDGDANAKTTYQKWSLTPHLSPQFQAYLKVQFLPQNIRLPPFKKKQKD